MIQGWNFNMVTWYPALINTLSWVHLLLIIIGSKCGIWMQGFGVCIHGLKCEGDAHWGREKRYLLLDFGFFVKCSYPAFGIKVQWLGRHSNLVTDYNPFWALWLRPYRKRQCSQILSSAWPVNSSQEGNTHQKGNAIRLFSPSLQELVFISL